MKHLKSSASDLHHMMESLVTVAFLCEPFVSFDHDKPVVDMREFLENKSYDTVGVRRDGLIVGYCKLECLKSGILSDHLIPINDPDVAILPDSASLLEAINCLENNPFIFITNSNHVFGIVTRGDLHKAPIRMWLFGIVTLIEMQLLRLLRKNYSEENWKKVLSKQRLEAAEAVLHDRKKRNEHIDLADCLQLCDKVNVFCKNDDLRKVFDFDSKRQCSDFFHNIENLRNELAHAQDVSAGGWPKTIKLAKRAEQILHNLEKA